MRHFSVLCCSVISTYTGGDSPVRSLTTSNLSAHPPFFSHRCRWFKQAGVDLSSWGVPGEQKCPCAPPSQASVMPGIERDNSIPESTHTHTKKDRTQENTEIMQRLPPPSWQGSPGYPRLSPSLKHLRLPDWTWLRSKNMNKLPLSESQLARTAWMGPSICYGKNGWSSSPC